MQRDFRTYWRGPAYMQSIVSLLRLNDSVQLQEKACELLESIFIYGHDYASYGLIQTGGHEALLNILTV
ncbi:MAG: hypothetical protein EZS28_040253 [Streblomastix strix]|uniref:Uncharacterized protein n=1 Tax=Streblomastix strix TaxID=222440 RepID=A0A5J4U227_9EUKA|nr:MAG: hypothetical protein EZS28_040253 [Streblomastix strix]